MSPERKHKHAPQPQDLAKQAHLEIKNEEMELSSKIDKLVSLTYDSDPKVRRSAAEELSKIDDPRSIFALLELSSDKNPEIKELAISNLNNFKQEKEAIVNLEKVFEARQEGLHQPADMAAARLKLMPSIEKLFSNKDPSFRARLMPSILEKYFSSAPQRQASDAQRHAVEARVPQQVVELGEGEDATQSAPRQDLGVEKMEEEAESSEFMPSKPSSSLSPKQQGEAAADFPLPESMRPRTASPIAEIESIMPEPQKEFSEEDEMLSLPPARIDFYKWAYALAVDPKMTAAKLRSEEKRLVTQLKKDVELAFRLAVKRATVSGIESLSGLKPGMRKVATFPLIVSAIAQSSLPSGKKEAPMARLLLTDGKHSVPLYIEPSRANGILAGDHISLHDARVDFLVEKNELVFLLGKKGYISVTK